MDNALTPREIQTRIRSGASVADVVEESGMDQARVEAFAGPVLAEREHIAGAAQAATIRRRGEASTHRKLGELITERLTSRGIDPETLEWDSWRQSDLKWRVVARLLSDAPPREGEFVFDPKARFSIADNDDARWLIGEEARGGSRPEEEKTVDFHDELALVRAVTDPEPLGDELPSSELMLDGNEDTSQLDRLYDMLSGISEDSVRIYTGILDPAPDPAAEAAPEAEPADDAAEPDAEPAAEEAEPEADEETQEVVVEEAVLKVARKRRAKPAAAPEPKPEPEAPAKVEADEPTVQVLGDDEATQDVLIDSDAPKKKAPRPRKRRAQVPSWDEIMFGGPTK